MPTRVPLYLRVASGTAIRSQFWNNLLQASRADDEGSLYELHLHGIQLLGSELIPLLRRAGAA